MKNEIIQASSISSLSLSEVLNSIDSSPCLTRRINIDDSSSTFSFFGKEKNQCDRVTETEWLQKYLVVQFWQ